MDDRLYRSRTDRMIAGVAGGLAERYDLDPSLVRIGWALVILFSGGLFLLLYIVMVIVVPEEPGANATPAAPTGTDGWAAAPASSAALTGSGPTIDPSPAGSAGEDAGSPATETSGTTSAAAPALSAREARRAARRERRDNSSAPLIFGAVLVIVGGLAFAGQVFPQIDFDLIWPIGLIVLGVALVLGATRRSST